MFSLNLCSAVDKSREASGQCLDLLPLSSSTSYGSGAPEDFLSDRRVGFRDDYLQRLGRVLNDTARWATADSLILDAW